MKTDISTILQHHQSIRNIAMDGKQTSAALAAMNDYAIHKIEEYKQDELKDALKESLRFFPALWKGELKMWLRKRAFLKAKAIADARCMTEGYKMYVILSSAIKYSVFSTKEVNLNKKIRRLKKDLTFKELESIAAYVANPKRAEPKKQNIPDKRIMVHNSVLSDESLEKLRQKKYVPEYLYMINSNKNEPFPPLFEFDIPDDKLKDTPYKSNKVHTYLILKPHIMKDLHKNSDGTY